MKRISIGLCVVGVLAGCGGGGNNSGQASLTNTSSTTYSPAVAIAGSQWNYNKTIVDNSNNTINLSYTDTVNSVNADGSFVDTVTDPTNTTLTVNGTNYSIDTVVYNVSSFRLVTSETINANVVCNFGPAAAGLAFPWSVGQTWNESFTETCTGSSTITVAQNGTVVDLEMLTTPAGTFTTLKFHNTITGPVQAQDITEWRDIVTGRTVQSIETISYPNGAPSGGYAVSITEVLQSYS